MSRASPLFLLLVLTGTLAHARAAPGSPEEPTPPPVPSKPPPSRDTRRSTPAMSDEDREVVENLELLESMDAAEDLELLLELSQQD